MIEGRPSRTALFVASCVLILGTAGPRYDELLPDEIVPFQRAILQHISPSLTWFERFFLLTLCNNRMVCRFLAWCVSTCISPKLFESIAFRKAFMEAQIRQFLEASVASSSSSSSSSRTTNKKFSHRRQVLVLGAGYDTLSLRLSRQYPHVIFMEVDHPAGNFRDQLWTTTLPNGNADDDSSTIYALLPEKPSNLHHAHVDLITPGGLVEALQHSKFKPIYDTSLPTIVVVEGLLAYLSTPQIQQLFDQVAQVVGTGSIVAFNTVAVNNSATTTHKNNNHHPSSVDLGWISFWAKQWVTQQGEPWLLGMDPDHMSEFFSNTPWKIRTSVQAYGPTRVATVQLQEEQDAKK